MPETVAYKGRCWMLDIKEKIQSEIQNIQYPETSIQDQPILTVIFITTTKFE